MAKNKNGKETMGESNAQTGSFSQAEKGALGQESPGSKLSHMKRRVDSSIIPEWIRCWALG
jgi:hypothetical protein